MWYKFCSSVENVYQNLVAYETVCGDVLWIAGLVRHVLQTCYLKVTRLIKICTACARTIAPAL